MRPYTFHTVTYDEVSQPMKGGVVHGRTLCRRICVNRCVVYFINHCRQCLVILTKSEGERLALKGKCSSDEKCLHVDGGRLFSSKRCEPKLDKKSGGDWFPPDKLVLQKMNKKLAVTAVSFSYVKSTSK